MTQGWHHDPYGVHQLRFHDGTAWTAHVADDGVQSTSPLPATPPAAPSLAQPSPDSLAAPTVRTAPAATHAAVPPAAQPPAEGAPRSGPPSGLIAIGLLVVALIVIGGLFVVLDGDGGGGGGDLGTQTADLDEGVAVIREVSLSAGDALLIQGLPDDDMDIDIGWLAAGDAIDRFEDEFGESVEDEFDASIDELLGTDGDDFLDDVTEGDATDDDLDRLADSQVIDTFVSSSDEGEGAAVVAPVDGGYFVVFYAYAGGDDRGAELRVERGPNFDLDVGDDVSDLFDAIDDALADDDLADFIDDNGLDEDLVRPEGFDG